MNIIAEIGWNWMGDMDLAKQMIKAAANNGATHVKTQVFNESRLKAGPWDTDGRREIYKKAQPSYDQLMEMKLYCEDQGVKFLASCMSVRDAKLYAKVTTEAIKIPGFESRNKELVQYAFDNFDIVIMSTGTSSVNEITDVISSLRLPGGVTMKDDVLLETISLSTNEYYHKLVLLHCVSSYPCDPKTTNLPKMEKLRLLFHDKFPGWDDDRLNGHVGFSDHIQGVESVKVALEYNIQWIEKHFTVDRSLPGRDNKFAILPDELKDLTDYIQLREYMNKDLGSGYQECEQVVREIQTGRFSKDV